MEDIEKEIEEEIEEGKTGMRTKENGGGQSRTRKEIV